MLRLCLPCCLLLLAGGCGILPEVYRKPQMHNPFPQLSKVAVAPFLNLSAEPTVDGRQFALAYFNALQSTPGFEVVPVGVVETAMRAHGIELRTADDARRLAQILNVDAVVIGAVTDFSPYYPPRCGLSVQWFAANPCYHPIPAGYGLPWGSVEEEFIPDSLVYESELALAKEQLKTQTPEVPAALRGGSQEKGSGIEGRGAPAHAEGRTMNAERSASGVYAGASDSRSQIPDSKSSPDPRPPILDPAPSDGAADKVGATDTQLAGTSLPADWPDPRGFIPPAPQPQKPTCWPSNRPVLEHTRTYNGNDEDFTTALATYVNFRDDARFAGWQGYLQRSDDFVRFCCYIHLAEMLTARGGAGKSQMVFRWHDDR